MAMNKKEKELLEDYKVKSSLHLSTGEAPQPDLEIPKAFEDMTFGFYVGYDTVLYGCSSSIGHATSYKPVSKTTSQNGIKLYSSKVEALKSLRFKQELEFASKLRRIDMWIEDCKEKDNE